MLIAGNWKMNGIRAFAQDLGRVLASRVSKAGRPLPGIVLCPPAPLLSVVADAIGGSAITLGAQDCHSEDKGAHTGDVSAALLADMGCGYVIVGHSERRTDHGETDQAVCAKAAAALRNRLIPIICVGETEAQRDRGETARVIERQVRQSVPEGADAGNSVIAYEPVWAIGTGRTPTAADIAAVHGQIRAVFAGHPGRDPDKLDILYGGSVKGANARAILAIPGVNGALVGGASLDAEDFWRIIEACP